MKVCQTIVRRFLGVWALLIDYQGMGTTGTFTSVPVDMFAEVKWIKVPYNPNSKRPVK